MAATRALHIYAGAQALGHLSSEGLLPAHVGIVPAAAGGPKGLILGRLDQFIFGHWLAQSQHPVDLVGASIGAWRMATACLADSVAAFQRLEHDYIRQSYAIAPGQKRPTPQHVSERFGQNLQAFYGGRIDEVLKHPRYRVHVVTSRGRHILAQDHPWRTSLGYLGAYLTNVVHRPAMGHWLERVVFSSPSAELPFGVDDYRTRHIPLTSDNFMAAIQASCSIPFMLEAVHNIPGGPRGAYWDGGITDYHLHLAYRQERGLVLYPHFQRQVVPGWLDKALTWRHRVSPMLANTIVLAPNPAWVAQLPNGKLPDRSDFTRYGTQTAQRVAVWQQAVGASQQLADEWADWLHQPDLGRVMPL
jgi:hypothetical protein